MLRRAARIYQRTQRHVPANPAKTIKISKFHRMQPPEERQLYKLPSESLDTIDATHECQRKRPAFPELRRILRGRDSSDALIASALVLSLRVRPRHSQLLRKLTWGT